MSDIEVPYCVDGCGREATTERLTGIIMAGDDFIECVDLVCIYHVESEDQLTKETP